MFCESYRETLNEAALSGEPLPARVQAHLEICVTCREAFPQEKALFALMDGELQKLVNAEVPVSLLPRVREQIAATVRKHEKRLASSLAYGTALAALTAITFLYSGRTKSPSPSATSAGSSVPLTATKEAFEPEAKPIRLKEFHAPLRSNQLRGRANHFPHEVLISEDEQIGFRRYEEMLRDHAGAVATAAIDDATLTIRPLQIAELDVKELSIEPLTKVDAEEASMKR